MARMQSEPGGVSASRGVRVAGVGHRVPDGRLTNADLERIMDTSDEWITQRTGIRERRVCDVRKGETPRWLCAGALSQALDRAGMSGGDLDLVIVATVSGEMTCPSTACRVAADVGAGHAGAFDILAACSGWVFSMVTADALIRAGGYRTVGVVGCDVMSRIVDYDDRTVSVLFGDAAGAAVLTADDRPGLGLRESALHADGSRWHDLYLPRGPEDCPDGTCVETVAMNSLQMNGREVYRFAVGTFAEVIERTLERAGLSAGDVGHFICHQSNARMLESARKRLGVEPERLPMNIDRYGNCSAGSVPLLFDELRETGRVKDGDLVMFVAFGGGLTWGTALWQL